MLELGEHRQHHPPGRGAGVDGLGCRAQHDAELVELFGQCGELAYLAAEAIDAVDQQQLYLALAGEIESGLQAGPVELRAGRTPNAPTTRQSRSSGSGPRRSSHGSRDACRLTHGCQGRALRSSAHRYLSPYVMPYTMGMRKTSVYLDEEQAQRLARLAREEGRPQAEILREAVAAYRSRSSPDRSFALAAGFPRIDADPRPISEIPEGELLEGFGR